MKLLNPRSPRSVAPRAFTIIEIALCLGIIGFALVAIIAVLPRGLDVQKHNRQETIVAQDAEIWMGAIRSGAHGYDDLTNYVMCITNFWTAYDAKFVVLKSGFDYYTPSNSSITSTNSITDFPLTNGARIIGLLSMPKRIPNYMSPPYQSNYVVAYVRAFSGSMVDKSPQTNSIIRGDAFTYRMVVENFPYTPVDTNSFCLDCPAAQAAINPTPPLSADQVTKIMTGRTNLMRTVFMLQTNANDFRLRFRWPVLPNGQIPSYGLLTVRSLVSGALMQTNDADNLVVPQYFVQPSMIVQGPKNIP
jgi:type II secretory pathway pseudopilin PulG